MKKKKLKDCCDYWIDRECKANGRDEVVIATYCPICGKRLQRKPETIDDFMKLKRGESLSI